MEKFTFLVVLIILSVCGGCKNILQKEVNEPIKAYDIDFNWGEGGPNGFAKPGLWADANPEDHVNWYTALGCNVIQSFAVSCNGYAWYKNGIVPEQPGLKYDFLTEEVRLAHKKNIKVFGYFCAGANTKWGLEHPDLSYGIPSSPHIPYTTQYLDYLCASIEDAIKKTDMDGVFIDWLWNPGTTMEPYPPLRWMYCEQVMYEELMGQIFPGKNKITSEIELQFRRKAIDRCWRRIRETVKKTKPDCLIWLTSCQLTSRDIAGSDMLKEVDWVLNEAGDIATTESVRGMLGPHTRLVTCLANWNGQDPTEIIPVAIKEKVGLYGFTKPVEGSMMPPVDYYLSRHVDSLKGDERNIAVLARAYNNLPFDFVKK
ncbi:MAG: hypothetical protein LLG13_02715 [Bacteroidales bacterium]|nr:hypothetical protein [Bacteroidales bacterium]